ncbi:hypothetical protein N7447_002468 [Penicillium robsamsonii]|uniref:uncharacterized protein n=1 Tax=Penicillium robsamsonii TaxID=1792511 RepID=UPI0025495116|nr:uncharacterized protein N7447_002468 [Penicillium robsamsonii]KAJ5836442.1 hypothetical protein N7447_002468 [Penicillium robsamsonii]
MGFISTLARRMRIRRLSKRLSTKSIKLHDEDSNDLIKTTSETASLTRISLDSTSTMVHHSLQPVLPSESSENRMQMRPDNGNMRTLFDENTTSHPRDRAARSPSKAPCPVLKLDCRSPVEAPRRVVQGPLEMGHEVKGGALGCSSATTTEKGFSPSEKCEPEKKDRRSMSALLKRHCGLNIPRSSISISTSSRGVVSPKWLDSAGLTEEEGLVEKRSEKWVEGGVQDEKRRNSVWGSVGFGKW